MNKTEEFSNRWGIILASLGMAIGAGNLWRFPRLAGQYGGTFLLLWVLFLLVWSIPILLAEFSMGKKARKSVIGSFAEAGGKHLAWMGFFITICTLGITFYYSVVTAWALRYLSFSVGQLFSGEAVADAAALTDYWNAASNESWGTVGLHLLAVVGGIAILFNGIRKGLEKANKLLIPSLFVLLILISAVSLSMENGWRGLEYMFGIRPELFSDSRVWIEALSQSAWSTGAGWGLMMTLSAYSRKKEDVTLNIFISGFGNNTASIMAGMAILPAVFALSPSPEAAIDYLKTGNQALTFTVIPQLFGQITGGKFLAVVFFGAFFLAAFSSLLPMLELFIKTLTDWGFTRQRAAVVTLATCVLMGFPSAWSLDFFSNQDWVWGVGLILSGLFIIVAAFKQGILTFKRHYIDLDSDFKVADWYFAAAMGLNVLLAFVLVYWWLSQGYSSYPWFTANGHWNLMDVYSNATVVTQWGVVLVAGILLNRFIYQKFNRTL